MKPSDTEVIRATAQAGIDQLEAVFGGTNLSVLASVISIPGLYANPDTQQLERIKGARIEVTTLNKRGQVFLEEVRRRAGL
jgi:hypothetical protein